MDQSKYDVMDQASQSPLLENRQHLIKLNASNAPLNMSKTSQNELNQTVDSGSMHGQRSKPRKKTLQIQHHLYGSQEQTRVSIISGNSYQRQSQLAQQSAVNAPSTLINQNFSSPSNDRFQRNSTMTALQTQNKIKHMELSPGQKHILSKQQQQSRHEGRYLASSHHTNFKMQKKNQMAQQSLVASKVTGPTSHQLHNLAYMQQSIAKNMAAFENESVTGLGSQSSQHKWAPAAARLNDTDLLKNIYSRDHAQSSEYLRYYNNLQQLNQQNSELRLAQKKNASSIFGANRMQNAKSIGLLDLRRQLNQNAKRVLSSKQLTLDDDIDLLLATTNVDPAATLLEPGGKWAQMGKNRYILNQSSSGKIETWQQGANVLQNKNLLSQTDAASTIATKGAIPAAEHRNTTSGFQSLTHFKSLDQEYIQNLHKNQKLPANANFDRFLQEKMLENEADRRIRVQKTSKDQFSLQTREVALKRNSQSPQYADKQQQILNEIQRQQAKGQRRRQIDTSQMLSDLRQSVKARELNLAQQQESIGEKMSLTGDQEVPRTSIVDVGPLAKEKSRVQSSQQQSSINQDNYSSKHYKANPLLLDEQVLVQAHRVPPEPARTFQKGSSSKKRLRELRVVKAANQEYQQRSKLAESGKQQSIVLQLEPKALAKDKSAGKAETALSSKKNNKYRQSNQRQKMSRFNDNLTVEEVDYYQSQMAGALNGDHSEDFESTSHQVNHSDALQNKLQNRPKTNKSSQKKMSATIKSNDHSAYKTQNLDELERNIDHVFAKSAVDHEGKYRNSNFVSNGSSVVKGGQPPEAYHQMEFEKQLQNSRSAMVLDKTMNIQQQMYHSSSDQQQLPFEHRNSNAYDYKVPPRSRNGQRFKGMLNDSNTVDDLHSPPRYRERLCQQVAANQQQWSGFSEISSMTKIKKQNLHKVDKKSFEHAGHRSAKIQSSIVRPGQQRSKLVKGSQQQSQVGLNTQIKNQELIPGIVGKINQNSTAFSDKELGLKLSAQQLQEARNRSIPRNPPKFKQSSRKRPTKKKSPAQSKAVSGSVSPTHQEKKLIKPIKLKKIEVAKDADEGEPGDLKMPKTGKNKAKKTNKADAEDTVVATTKNASTLDEDTKVTGGADVSQSLQNAMVIEPKSQSNQDEKSSRPVQERQVSNGKVSEQSAEEQGGGNQNSLIVRKIKRRSKNTRSEPFLFTKSTRNRSQISNNDAKDLGSGANAGERSAAARDARVAALNLAQPRRYQSVMNSHSMDRPSLRESLLKRGKRPANHRPQRALSEYPGFDQEVRESAEEYTAYAKSLYQAVGINSSKKRANSARDVDIRGLKYKFKVVDIAKYTDSLKYGIFNWPVRYCSIGKKKPKPQARKEVLVKEIHFDTLLAILKETDWTKTPLYQKYREHGRWINDDEEIYSEIEVNYLSSTLHHMMNKGQNIEEFNEAEGQAIIKKHWAKTMSTLKKLMLQMNMMYYWEKLKLHYSKLEQPGHRPKIQQLEKLLLRCKKLYDQINSFMKIFKLIEVKQLRDQQNYSRAPAERTEKDINKEEVLIKRLIIAICLLLKENPILPLSFNFGGECLLERLKREKDNLKNVRQQLEKTK